MVRLHEALAETQQGRGQFVVVLGEAGIGKSRLVAELAHAAIQLDLRILFGRCYEGEEILAFGPWVDGLRRGRIADEREVLDELPPSWRALVSRLLPELDTVGSPSASDPPDYLALFDAVSRLLARLGARHPVVFILEDLHWADEMSLRLLSFLGHRLLGCSILVIATARIEEIPDAPPLRHALEGLDGEPHVVKLVLPPLSRAETLALVRTLAPAGSQDGALGQLGEQVWRTSDGNPFIAVEAMRGLQHGALVPLTRTLSLPERAREVITRRISRLGDRGQQLIAVAAVIGREFEFVLLRRAAGISEHDAAAGVEELVRRQVLQNMGDHFDFTHERIRAVTYDQIFSPRRVLLHRAVAEAIETLYRGNLEPHYLSLGAHYFEGRVWDKAVAYLQHAANAALERSAYHEALAGFEKALVALGHLPDGPEKNEGAADLHSQIREALYPLGDDQAIIEHLRQAEALTTTLGDQRRLAKALSRITQYHWQMGEPDEGIEIGDRALAIAEALGEVGLVIRISQYLGQIHRDRGDAARAKEIFAQYVDRFDGDRRRERFEAIGYPAVSFLANLASYHALLGEFAEGIARGAQALRLAEEIDHPFTIDNACRWFAHVYLLKGDLDAAVPLLERALELTRARGQGEVATRARARLGYALALSGQVDEAVTILEDLRSPAMGKGRSLWPLTNIWLAEAYVLAGRLDDAQVEARRALALARHQKARGNEAWALLVLGEIAARREPPDAERAGEHCKLALALAGELRMRPLVARYHLALGGLYQRTGAPAPAASHLANAADMFRRMDMIFWLRKVQPLLGRLPGPPSWSVDDRGCTSADYRNN